MGAFYETIPKPLIDWTLLQKVFWVATAPLSGQGHVNISPKGGCYFGILSPTQFWYIDLTGSGSETLSHLHEPGNGRITIQFNAFDGPPKIVRFWGKGNVLEYGTDEFKSFVEEHKVNTIAGTRAIVLVDIHQVGSSCGFSVPKFEFQEFRPTLNEFFEKRVKNEEMGNRKDGIERYWAFKNAYSMDGLPSMKRALSTGKRESVTPMKKMVGKYENYNITKDGSRLENVATVYLFIIALLGVFAGAVGTIVLQVYLGIGIGFEGELRRTIERFGGS